MNIIKGKYNTATIFTDNIEETAKEQIRTYLDLKEFKDTKIRIMPDVHAGAGCVIGFTSTYTDKIVPNLVGVDIGCGMTYINLGEVDIDLKGLDEFINDQIPHGFSIRNKPIDSPDIVVDETRIKSLIYNRNITDKEYICDRAIHSLGTLGGGNHFIEVSIDSNDNKWLIVHSGSRYFGFRVAQHWQSIAKEKHPEMPKDLEYLEGSEKFLYMDDMIDIVNYAKSNRSYIIKDIMKFLRLTYNSMDVFDTIHNYIDTKDKIIRKGAISAKWGERLLIPINMKDGSILGIGKGNIDWNYSGPHGAGRVLSRKKAKSQIKFEDFENSMKGIYSSSVTKETLDESPFAYKSIEEISQKLQDSVYISSILKPIYNFKSH